MSLTLTILGCGSSGGVPRVAAGWGACDPAEPRNRRGRCSILLRRTSPDGGETVVLVDTSPDLREQLLRTDVRRLDGIVLTHPHADHTHGIDDVRPVVMQMRQRIALMMDEPTSAIVRRSFAYIFETPPGSLYPPLLDEKRIAAGTSFGIDGPGGSVDLTPFRLHHGEIDALGLRIGNVAYTPDVHAIPDESLSVLHGLDLWIIDALRYTPHPSHFSVSDALGWIERMRPRQAILTNLHNDLDYATLSREVPRHVTVAYDGMTIAIDEDGLPSR
jgi:phosphoribosyl 1,2-cyclic phosphate phosphodiesterase